MAKEIDPGLNLTTLDGQFALRGEIVDPSQRTLGELAAQINLHSVFVIGAEWYEPHAVEVLSETRKIEGKRSTSVVRIIAGDEEPEIYVAEYSLKNPELNIADVLKEIASHDEDLAYDLLPLLAQELMIERFTDANTGEHRRKVRSLDEIKKSKDILSAFAENSDESERFIYQSLADGLEQSTQLFVKEGRQIGEEKAKELLAERIKKTRVGRTLGRIGAVALVAFGIYGANAGQNDVSKDVYNESFAIIQDLNNGIQHPAFLESIRELSPREIAAIDTVQQITLDAVEEDANKIEKKVETDDEKKVLLKIKELIKSATQYARAEKYDHRAFSNYSDADIEATDELGFGKLPLKNRLAFAFPAGLLALFSLGMASSKGGHLDSQKQRYKKGELFPYDETNSLAYDSYRGRITY